MKKVALAQLGSSRRQQPQQQPQLQRKQLNMQSTHILGPKLFFFYVPMALLGPMVPNLILFIILLAHGPLGPHGSNIKKKTHTYKNTSDQPPLKRLLFILRECHAFFSGV